MKSFIALTLAVSCAAGSALPRAAAAEPPACALLCIEESLLKSSCAITNQTCICTNAVLNEQITLCVTETCTIREQLTTKKYSEDSCGAPIRDRTMLVPTLGTIFGSLAMISFILRILERFNRASPGSFGLDDISLGIIMILMIDFYANSWLLEERGLGRDIWQISFDQITGVLYYFFFQELIYLTVLPLLKITFLLLYLRVFPDKTFRKIVYFMFGLNVAYGIAFVGVSIWQCVPVRGAWTRWDGTFEGRCNNINIQGWTSAAFNIINDIITLSLPLVPLSKLNLPNKKKAQVMLMFGVGFFVTIVSILRLYSLVQFGGSTNVTYDYVPVSYWTTIEIEVGIICVCMPAIFNLLQRYMPKIFGISTVAESGRSSNPISSKTSKFSAKPSIGRAGHSELGSIDDLGLSNHSETELRSVGGLGLDSHSQHELVDIERRGSIGEIGEIV